MAPDHRFIPGVWLTVSLTRFFERVGAKAFIPVRPAMLAEINAGFDRVCAAIDAMREDFDRTEGDILGAREAIEAAWPKP